MSEDIRERIRKRYAAAARSVGAGSPSRTVITCADEPAPSLADADGREVFGAVLYDETTSVGATESSIAASFGCGVPTAIADLQPGQTVLDLGSGAGADVLISARRVAPGGRAIGLDMTMEMVELARRNAMEAGIDNVEFLEGYLEDIPLPDASIDVAISNCVINLATDKRAVLAEAARVLRPGGQLAVTDVIMDSDLDDATRADVANATGCITGALTCQEFSSALTQAGLVDVEIEPTHKVHAYASSAIIRARKPR